MKKILITASIVGALVTTFLFIRKKSIKSVKASKGWIQAIKDSFKYFEKETQTFVNFDDANGTVKSAIKVLSEEIANGKWGYPVNPLEIQKAHENFVKENMSALSKLFY